MNTFDDDVTDEDYLSDFQGECHDVRDLAAFAECLDPDRDVVSQQASFRDYRHWGILVGVELRHVLCCLIREDGLLDLLAVCTGLGSGIDYVLYMRFTAG